MSASVLHRIAGAVRVRLEERKAVRPEAQLRVLVENARTPHSFVKAFQGGGIHVLAEIKFASPSQGAISGRNDPVAVAGEYLKNGAVALSVLTEQDHFQGHPEYLMQVRRAYPEARLLMKDFILEEYQLLEARVLGADAALLIVALLGEVRTKELLNFCRGLGLTALVEVHNEDEFQIATRIGADLIGINNRDLKTLEVSLDTSRRLAVLAPKGVCLISESGIGKSAELQALRELGYSGFLIGTTFMKTGKPGEALSNLLAPFNQSAESDRNAGAKE